MTRIYKTIFVLACLILAAMACRKDPDPRKEDHGFQLNAMDLQMDGSRQPGAKSFENGIKYAMFIVETPQTSGQRDWSDPILHGQGEENNGYIRLPKNVSYEDRTFDFYGLTLGSTDPIYPSEAIEYTPDNASSPIYYLKATPRESANGKGTYYDLPDLRRGELLNRNADNSEYILSLPFKHSLAKLRLEVVRQDEGELDETSILSVKLHNAYSAGRLNVENNTFDFTGETPVSEGILLYEGAENDFIPLEGDSLSEALIFPYVPANHGNTPLSLEIETNRSTIGTNGTEVCNIVIPSTEGNAPNPLEIKSNVIYTIRINVTTDEVRVLTIVPSYYEWLDTEVAEFEMGIPVNFNGVLWSDRNLGATNPNPLESADAWDESVGYFYQFGRNIPYFPYVPVNSYYYEGWNRIEYISGVKVGELQAGALQAGGLSSSKLVYPVIDLSSWNLGSVSPDRIEWKPSTGYIYNQNNIIRQIGEIPNSSSNTNKLLGYFDGNENNMLTEAPEFWADKENHPCPAGWRLPTADEWRSILPYSPISGNFSMQRFKSTSDAVSSDGSWYALDTYTNSYTWEQLQNEYRYGNLSNITVPVGGSSPYSSSERAYDATSRWPYFRRVENNRDPVQGQSSVYIISLDDEDVTHYTCTNRERIPNVNTAYQYQYNWGKIYCIKNVGTSEAYRLRWSIKFAGTDDQNGNTPATQQHPRCVVVIERFPVDNDIQIEDFTVSNFKNNFDWSHPVEVLYLPIAGLISPSWGNGVLFNVGGEVTYASSEARSATLSEGCWIKTVGDNMTNMQISAVGAQQTFGFQVRCVRDTEY